MTHCYNVPCTCVRLQLYPVVQEFWQLQQSTTALGEQNTNYDPRVYVMKNRNNTFILLCPNSLKTNDYSILKLCSLCINVTMVWQIQACQQTAHMPGSALSL